MVCNKCGADIAQDQLFCPKCGNEINLVAEYDVLDDFMVSLDILDDDHVEKKQKKNHVFDRLRFVLERRDKKNIFFIVIFVFILSLATLFGITYVKNQNSVDYQMKKAVYYFEHDQFESCIKTANKLRLLDENNVKVYELLADSHMALQNKENAIFYYETVLGKEPDCFTCYQKLFHLYKEDEKYLNIKDCIEASPIKEELIFAFRDFYPVKPKFSQESGLYHDKIYLSLFADPSEVIYYSLDGSKPDSSSILYQKPIELSKEGSYEVKAVAVNKYDIESEVGTGTYDLQYPIPSPPIVTPATGTYPVGTLMKVVTDDEKSNAYYTLNGSLPSVKSKQYSLPIPLRKGKYEVTVVCINKYGKVSSPTTKSYVITQEEEEENKEENKEEKELIDE